MDDGLKYTYLWHEIIRMAFTPTRDYGKWILKWFKYYLYGICEFLELGDNYSYNVEKETLCSKIFIPFLKLHLDIKLKIEEKWDNIYLIFCEKKEGVDQTNHLWAHDIGQDYFCVSSLPLLSEIEKICSYRGKVMMNYADRDLERILEAAIFHPKAHQHIHTPVDNHDIRIGGGFCNPFQYLFHLRYQLCIIQDKRKSEENRLFRLFNSALRKNDPELSICPEELNEVV